MIKTRTFPPVQVKEEALSVKVKRHLAETKRIGDKFTVREISTELGLTDEQSLNRISATMSSMLRTKLLSAVRMPPQDGQSSMRYQFTLEDFPVVHSRTKPEEYHKVVLPGTRASQNWQVPMTNGDQGERLKAMTDDELETALDAASVALPSVTRKITIHKRSRLALPEGDQASVMVAPETSDQKPLFGPGSEPPTTEAEPVPNAPRAVCQDPLSLQLLDFATAIADLERRLLAAERNALQSVSFDELLDEIKRRQK